MIIDKWQNCYGEGWKNILNDEAFAHPAKYSRALIRQIYKHAIDEGWIKAGDTVLDPFGGIGAGALDAMLFKINWIGIELERHFFDIAIGCDCTGITKADWIRFHKRPNKSRYLDGRNWCPRCVAEISRIEDSPSHLELFDLPESASYVRNNGKIPSVSPHRYVGNIETWKSKTNFAGAEMINGDSRRLCEILRTEAEFVVSSPPYFGISPEKNSDGIDLTKQYETYRKQGGGTSFDAFCATQRKHSHDYGNSPGQLGAMREGDFSASISSPPYAHDTEPHGDLRPEGLRRNEELSRNYSAVISSPPYAQSIHDGNGIDADKLTGNSAGANSQAFAEGYGKSDGQLAKMPEGKLDAAISSPPYAQALGNRDHEGDQEKYLARQQRYKELHPEFKRPDAASMAYGSSGGQLAAMTEGQFDASVSSPPWENNAEGGVRGDKFKDSIAFAKEMSKRDDGKNNRHKVTAKARIAQIERENNRIYGNSEGQIGIESGETFWSAAKQIVEQVHASLKPRGKTIWILKDYVRNRERVPFCERWMLLCESVGFKTLHWHRAWLVEDYGTQQDLFGNHKQHKIARKSFFRRLAEKNGSPRIDFEVVLCMEKK